MEPADAFKHLDVVRDQLKAALDQAIHNQDGDPVPGYRERLGKALEDLEKTKATLADRLKPPAEPPMPAPPHDVVADVMARAERAKQRAAEIEAARTLGALDRPPIPFQGDYGLDAGKTRALIHSLLQGIDIKAAPVAAADPGSVSEAMFTEPAPGDDWPAELRTPTSGKKTATPPARKPRQPAPQDESIGNAWADEDE